VVAVSGATSVLRIFPQSYVYCCEICGTAGSKIGNIGLHGWNFFCDYLHYWQDSSVGKVTFIFSPKKKRHY
jgi:hypothetical protein